MLNNKKQQFPYAKENCRVGQETGTSYQPMDDKNVLHSRRAPQSDKMDPLVVHETKASKITQAK